MFLITVVLFFVVIVGVFRFRRQRLYELARKVPGRPSLPVIGHLHHFIGNPECLMTALKGRSHDAMKYGGLTKFWLGHILYFMTVDALDITHILQNCLEKDDSIKFIRDVIGDGLLMAPKLVWKHKRKKINPAFSKNNMNYYVEVFSKESLTLIDQLRKRVGTGKFDAWPYLTAYTLDTVAGNTMGKNLNAQTSSESPMVDALSNLMEVMCERYFKPWLHLDWVFWFAPSYRSYQDSKNLVHNFIDKKINKLRQGYCISDDSEDEVDCYETVVQKMDTLIIGSLTSQSSKHGEYNNKELRDEVLSITAAALETSALTMAFTLLMLGRHQDVQDKVYRELQEIYGDSERPLVNEDLSKMVYLERVIKETLRMYPVVAFTSREIELELKLPSGKVLPKGSRTIISYWGLHHNPAYWGDNVEDFDPDRFAPDRYKAYSCAYLPFSTGPRNCIGYQYGMVTVKTALSAILRNYRVMVTEEILKSPEIPVKFELTMKAVNGYNILIEDRIQPVSNCNKLK